MDDATIIRLTGVPAEGVNAANMVDMVGVMALGVDPDDVTTLIDSLGRYQTTGPIFDPTNYMRHGDNAIERSKLMHAFLKFRTAFETYHRRLSGVA